MKLNFLNNFKRAYDCGDDSLAAYTCVDCIDALEYARIGQGAFIHKGAAYDAISADPETAATWQTYIDSGDVVILPNLQGTYDGGAPVTVAGYGRVTNKTTGYNFTANIHDPVYAGNYDFYKSLVGNSGWHFVFLTSSQGHITGVPVNVTPKNPITVNLTDVVEWQSDITWSESFAPKPFTAPQSIFECQ